MNAGTQSFAGEGRPLRGEVRVPGCKAISHRALLFAALADGVSSVRGLAPGRDVAGTLAAVRALGVEVHREDDGSVVLTSRGVRGLREPAGALECGNSGTTMRMLSGLVAGLPIRAELTGDEYLARRPMARVVEPLRSMGARIEGRDGGDHPPLSIRGGGLRGVNHELAVASGQVKTALALAGLQADGTTEVREPVPSRDDTELMLTALGAPIARLDPCTFRVVRGAPVPFELQVPGDPSSAAFFAVAACVVPGSAIVLRDIALNPTRLGFTSVLRRMGAGVEIIVRGDQLGEAVGDVRIVAAPLQGTVVSGGEIPTLIDEIPVLAVAAACAEGVTEFRDAAEMRVKESDRVATSVELLRRAGIEAEPLPDGLVVHGRGSAALQSAAFDSHGDHRIAMAAAVAALAATGTSEIAGWDAVAVSYPAFATDLRRVAGGVKP